MNIKELGGVNIQGEVQQKLDVVSDNQFIKMFESGGEVCGIASEKNDDFVAFDSDFSRKGKIGENPIKSVHSIILDSYLFLYKEYLITLIFNKLNNAFARIKT